MDERLRFIARLLEGERMAPVCREFGISRVTGYKIFDRYKECGLDGLYDRSKAPYRQANRLPFRIADYAFDSCTSSAKNAGHHPMTGDDRRSIVTGSYRSACRTRTRH